MSEADIQSDILLLGRGPVRLFRNTVGEGWTGELARRDGDMVLLKNARHVTFGLCKGSSDLIGWRSIVVTPDMIGQTIAVFSAVEVKTETGRVQTHQANFIGRALLAGALAGVARSRGQAAGILKVAG